MRRLIFGCGYLGKKVAQRWLGAGDTVYALTRSKANATEFERAGIHSIVGDITQPDSISDLPQVDTVLFSVGMDRSRYDDIRTVYVAGLQNVIAQLTKLRSKESENGPAIGQFIYVSSTGVYGDFDGQWIDETAPTNPKREGGKACLEAENLIAESLFSDRATILRFAGIYGPNRVPTQSSIAKDQSKLVPSGYLNLVHVDDGAALIERVSNQTNKLAKTETFNVSDGKPPKRKEYYDFIAAQMGLAPIQWDESLPIPENSRASSSKRISNRKLIQQFQCQFAYPDFRSGLTQAMSLS